MDHRWTANANGTIASVSSGMCLDVYQAATSIRTPVNVYPCHGNANQRWTLGDGAAPGVSVLTNRNDNLRTGANARETFLTTSNVNSAHFGLLFLRTVDGQQYAQPLYMSHLVLADGVARNVVFAAAMHNTVYAFDANGRRRRISRSGRGISGAPARRAASVAATRSAKWALRRRRSSIRTAGFFMCSPKAKRTPPQRHHEPLRERSGRGAESSGHRCRRGTPGTTRCRGRYALRVYGLR